MENNSIWRNSVKFATILADNTDEEWMELLAEETGIFAPSGLREWRVTHRALQEILSADHIVKSIQSIDDLLGESFDLTDENNFRAIRYACSETDDASELVQYVMKRAPSGEGDKSVLLAELLTSFFHADQGLMKQCKSMVISWLDKTASSWHWTISESNDLPVKWSAEARLTKNVTTASDPENIVGVIRAVHRSRLYRNRVKEWRREFLAMKNEDARHLAEVLDEDGVLDANCEDKFIRITIRDPSETWVDENGRTGESVGPI